MMGMNQYLRRRVAYHEAGHAVVAHKLSVPIRFVTIRPDGKNAGTLIKVEGQPVTETSDVNVAMVSFAGPMAEVEFCGKDSGGWFSWRGDFAEIKERLRLSLDTHNAYLDNAYYDDAYRSLRAKTKRDALALVQKHKPSIERVA